MESLVRSTSASLFGGGEPLGNIRYMEARVSVFPSCGGGWRSIIVFGGKITKKKTTTTDSVVKIIIITLIISIYINKIPYICVQIGV